MEINTEERLKLTQGQLKLSLETTQEFMNMWTKNYQSTLGKLAQVPAFGPVREKQEKIMKSMPIYSKLYTTWIDSNISLHSVLLEAMRKTFEKTAEYQINSAKSAKDGKSYMDPDKYKEFYNIWIDAYSTTFKDFMKSEHYSSDMGKFASVFIDFQAYNREMIEDNYLKPNNLPTKTDIEIIHKELYDLRRTVKELLKAREDTNKIDYAKKVALYNRLEQSKKVELRNIGEQSKKEELHNEEEQAAQIEMRDLKTTVEKLTEDIKELKNKEDQAKKLELQSIENQAKQAELRNEEEQARQAELRDLKKIVEDLTEYIKELKDKDDQAKKVELQNKEVQAKKVELQKKEEQAKKVEEQAKKVEVHIKKEVHTK